VTHLRKIMLEELERRNYPQTIWRITAGASRPVFLNRSALAGPNEPTGTKRVGKSDENWEGLRV
jgi:hypothetical protein